MPNKKSERLNKDEIIKVASVAFAEIGFDRTTMETIAENAGVDVRSLSDRFGSKEELLIEAFRASHRRMERAMQHIEIVNEQESNLQSLFKGLMEMASYWGTSEYLSILYQATKIKKVNEIARAASERTVLSVKSFLVDMMQKGIIGESNTRAAAEDLIASFVEQLASMLKGRKEVEVREAWLKEAELILSKNALKKPLF